MALFWSSYSNLLQLVKGPISSSFQEIKLHESFQAVTFHHDALKTTIQALTSLSSQYMLFHNKLSANLIITFFLLLVYFLEYYPAFLMDKLFSAMHLTSYE